MAFSFLFFSKKEFGIWSSIHFGSPVPTPHLSLNFVPTLFWWDPLLWSSKVILLYCRIYIPKHISLSILFSLFCFFKLLNFTSSYSMSQYPSLSFLFSVSNFQLNSFGFSWRCVFLRVLLKLGFFILLIFCLSQFLLLFVFLSQIVIFPSGTWFAYLQIFVFSPPNLPCVQSQDTFVWDMLVDLIFALLPFIYKVTQPCYLVR